MTSVTTGSAALDSTEPEPPEFTSVRGWPAAASTAATTAARRVARSEIDRRFTARTAGDESGRPATWAS